MCHPDDFDAVMSDANQAGLMVVPFGDEYEDWRFRIVTTLELPYAEVIQEDLLYVSDNGTVGEVFVADLNGSLVEPPVRIFIP